MAKIKVLITGATGFVGSNLIYRLVHDNYEVHFFKRKNSSLWRIKDIISRLNSHEVDLQDKKRLLKILGEIKPKIIFHLANLGLYGGIDSPIEESIKINLLGTINLIESTHKIDYDCFINTGSSSEYGIKQSPMSEDDLCRPDSNYALTKLASSLWAQSYAVKNKKPLATLRLFSPFGPFDHPSRFITQTILNLIRGKDIYIKSSNAVRDYIFIEDVVEAFMLCIKNTHNLSGEIFNIGYGRQTTIRDVLELLTKQIDSNSRIFYEDSAKDKNMWQANIQKAKKKLKWYPKKPLKDGLQETVDWFKKNVHFYG